jgi:predicted AlkP superfamily phosphohydrolase/phosphomutase
MEGGKRRRPRRGTSDSRHMLALVLLLASLAAIAAAGPACSPKPTPPARVIFLGIDAVDYRILGSLVDQGRLPNFSRLAAKGATGKLNTLQPLQKSPIIWTSIATGMLPDKHGIGGFVARTAGGDSVPYTGNVRRVKALWDILGEKGMTVGVVGWMVTWPAAEVNGYLVSDYIQYETERGIRLDRQTYPESLFAEIEGMRLTEASVSDQAIAAIYPVTAPSARLSPDDWHKGYVKMVYATDETFRRIALNLEKKGVGFLAVYFNGIDSVCHAFWDFRSQPGHPLAGVIDDYYVWIDGVLGEFMDLMDRETMLVVCSDHGFAGPGRTADGALLLGVYMHGNDGYIGLAGKNIRKGTRLPACSVLDVCPTVLYALGLPVAADMDGSVLVDGFTPGCLEFRPVAMTPTYETGRRAQEEPLSSPVDDKVKAKLKALGYIQ